MILVALGTQDLPFDRLLAQVDKLVEEGVIQEEVLAQTGFSTYRPRHYVGKSMMPFAEFDQLLDSCRFLIAHGGTGTLVGALKKGKKVIASPRLQKYGEHVDDHQTEIIGALAEAGMLLRVDEMEDLAAAVRDIEDFEPKPYVSTKHNLIELLRNFVENIP